MKLYKTSFSDEKVLITGGAGFIGSHLVRRLLNNGAKVSIIVRKSTDLWKIDDIKNEIQINYCDIQDKEKMNKIITAIRPKYVFHLAAYGVNSKKNNYTKAVNVNVVGALNLIEPLTHIGCEKFIYMGSSSEYGGGEEERLEKNALFPLNIYGSTKAAASMLLHQIARENKIDMVTLRPFGLFGEREEQHKIFSYIIVSLLKGKEVKLTSCEQYRDYIYVENLVDAMLLASNSSIKNEIFNIGTGKKIKLKYYVERIFEKVGTIQKPQYGALEKRKNDMMCPFPNVDKIHDLLKWHERVSLDEGLSRTIEWYKNNISYYS